MPPLRQDTPDLINHWTPMPELDAGRALLACYAIYPGQPDLFDLVSAYQQPLRATGRFAAVEQPWLHSTMQGLAFLDDLPANAAVRLAEAMTDRLSGLAAPIVTVEPPLARDGGVDLPLSPINELAQVRAAVQQAAADALDLRDLYLLPGQAGQFDPHISLAYANQGMDSAPIRRLLDAVPHPALTLTLNSFAVIALRRSNRTWHWSSAIAVPAGRRRRAVLT